MAIYFGTRSIAARLGYRSPQSVINRHEKRNEVNPLPMYPRIKGRDWVWCISEPLLQLWEVRETNLSRTQRIARLRLPRRKRGKTLQKDLTDGRREWTASPFSAGGGIGTSREGPDKICRICGGTEPHGTDKCCRIIDGEKPPRDTGLPVPQFRSRSLPSRIASEHFARRMRVGRTRRQ